MTPSGTSVLGLVKHLAAVQYMWFCETFGRETEPLPFDDDDEDADLRVGADESAEDVLAFYRRARAAAGEVFAEVLLHETGTAWFGKPVSMRCVLIHMVEETARHAGHLDIVRELLDGSTGDHRRGLDAVLPAETEPGPLGPWRALVGFGPGDLSLAPAEVDVVVYGS